jgi:glucosamine kinase
LCQTNPGVACILGTGSNSCYYNGSEIVDNVSPLGFILGDEGSGAVLGKILIGDILKKQLSPILINDFFDTYPTSVSEILENVYRKPFPSRYLAGYTKFLSKNIRYPEIENIVIRAFHEFVTRNLLQYPGIDRKPVHFTGSIAFHFEEQLLKVIKERNLISGNIERSPMRGLVEYHISKPV